jgi:hypothetical protein
MIKERLQLTRRFGVMAAVARRKCSATLEVCRPLEIQWKPPLRQAAGTLAVTRETVSRKSDELTNRQRGKTCEAVRAGNNNKFNHVKVQ